LKQTIADLKEESRNAEDLNNQMALEIEQKIQENLALKRSAHECRTKLTSSLIETDYLQKTIETLKLNIDSLGKENENLKFEAKSRLNELKNLELQLVEFKTKQFDFEIVLNELNKQKVKYIICLELQLKFFKKNHFYLNFKATE
jgi:hypothetical protein